MLRRGAIALSMVSLGILVLLLLLNVGGWRERVLKRVLRVNNAPTVVSPPPDFQPRVPAGFRVSVFARGFQQPLDLSPFLRQTVKTQFNFLNLFLHRMEN